MDKTTAGLIGALCALAAAPSHAATSAPVTLHEAMEVSSYTDLLRPIPNAAALLREASAQDEAMTPDGQGAVETVQYYYHHHHHHHHHRYYRRRYHHHHHHHHHNYY